MTSAVSACSSILLIGPQAPPSGGMALQARQLLSLLRADGHTVFFLASNLAFPGPLRFLDRLPGVRTPCRSALIWFKLLTEMRRVSVVHVLAASWVYFFSVVVPAVAVGSLRGKRVILNYRGGDAKRFFHWWGWLIGPVFRAAGLVTAPSRFLATVIEARFKVPVQVVPNMIDSSVFRYRMRPAVAPKFLVARNLEKIYDVESVLKAFRLIQERHAEATLWIAGSGSQEPMLRAQTAAWKLDNVRFLGQVPHQSLPGIYDQCDILLNASLVDNFPGALLEASAAGLVVVSTGAGGIPHMYRDGENALLVEPGDWRALGSAAEKVLQTPSLAKELSVAGKKLAESCEWKEVRKALYRAYAAGPSLPEDNFDSRVPADAVRTGK